MPKTDPHEDFAPLHDDILRQTAQWREELYMRTFGFSISGLERAEANLAYLVTSEALTPEGKAERDRLIAEYKEKWLPCRRAIQDRFAGRS